MSYLKKNKFIKIKNQLNELGFNGEQVLEFIEKEGYDEFLFLANNIEFEKDEEILLIIADFVHLVIEKKEENYTLKIE
ncbi:MAG: hypothetical protein KA277_04460 [Fusobacteriaceae bacterium]|jgi:hypothetical protein|nr:hypothetical protein [Fusobacteriaceae bacterium]MBP6467258.1 hypothetical protein [Fusobacteriaceae bacterium]MBP9595511.1 hypothetical protein [Fusobacteriaceae bacterium]MBU9917052.1 hypothetical protein [Fusobacteriaceae bacterium]